MRYFIDATVWETFLKVSLKYETYFLLSYEFHLVSDNAIVSCLKFSDHRRPISHAIYYHRFEITHSL